MRAELRQADGAAVDAVYIIKSELGCQQGDPLSPLYFAVALMNALHPYQTQQVMNQLQR